MEFEAAARRLANDQSKLKKGRARRTPVVSQKAKREADFRKRQQERLRQERARQQRALEYQRSYVHACERALGVKVLSFVLNDNNNETLQLEATSIHGEGDKVALPPSVLQFLTEKQQLSIMEDTSDDGSSPWMFRIGILRSGYSFPASPLMQNLQPPEEEEVDNDNVHMEDDQEAGSDNHDDDDDENNNNSDRAAYLDELQHKYVAYTHGTVVEFTQDEGHVGLPASIASRLLSSSSSSAAAMVPTTRTQDPSAAGKADDDALMTDDGDKTPGHLAWGAFDVPKVPVEISLVRLPKGRNCTLIPTREAIRNGFHQLRDVKLVLEQSLIRTRATLTVGDTVHAWHRGVKFDLTVASVTPGDFRAVSCINTDIEVEIGVNEQVREEEEVAAAARAAAEATNRSGVDMENASFAPGKGQILSSSSSGRTVSTADAASPATSPPPNAVSEADLFPEPPLDQTEGICTVQIRAPNGTGRRRFDVRAAKLKDLFAFASFVANSKQSFQLVTRFPRRVHVLNHETGEQTLEEVGIVEGQEMFLVEQLL